MRVWFDMVKDYEEIDWTKYQGDIDLVDEEPVKRREGKKDLEKRINFMLTDL